MGWGFVERLKFDWLGRSRESNWGELTHLELPCEKCQFVVLGSQFQNNEHVQAHILRHVSSQLELAPLKKSIFLCPTAASNLGYLGKLAVWAEVLLWWAEEETHLRWEGHRQGSMCSIC